MAPLIRCDRSAHLRENGIPGGAREPRGRAVRDERRALLEGRVDEAQVRVVLRFGVLKEKKRLRVSRGRMFCGAQQL